MLVTNFKHIRREKTALQTVAMLRRLPSRTKVILLNSVLRTVIDLTPASGIYRYRTWVALLIQFVFIEAARRARDIDDYFSPVISLDILELEHAVLEPSE